jgi:hypothetical protein
VSFVTLSLSPCIQLPVVFLSVSVSMCVFVFYLFFVLTLSLSLSISPTISLIVDSISIICSFSLSFPHFCSISPLSLSLSFSLSHSLSFFLFSLSFSLALSPESLLSSVDQKIAAFLQPLSNVFEVKKDLRYKTFFSLL